MLKEQRKYVCQECGYISPQWLGRCPECNKWKTFVEEYKKEPAYGFTISKTPTRLLSEIKVSPTIRIKTGIHEFDRVLGGGIVEGALILVGGEPGIGKSTLLLQMIDCVARNGKKVLYISGEESPSQVKLRASRFGIESKNINILAQIDIEEIVSEIEKVAPNLIVVDSIQAIYNPSVDALPGSVSQVRECAFRLMEIAKSKHIPTFIIGHVTKEGTIAGPRILEHMVDTVLYLEGDKNHFYRILRAVKNRFGSTHEIGVFEMKETGLQEVKDPSMMFLGERTNNISGNVVTCAIEGTRPFLVEIQALLSPSVYRMPQRVVSGIEYNRLSMLLAVIERRIGIRVSTYDVFINVVGGLRIEERASDLAIILAIVSGVKGKRVIEKTAILGEVGLGGEVRPVGLMEKRIKEIERLGFTRCIGPSKCKSNISIVAVQSVSQAIHEAINHHSKL
jgi:DNA repair protein RadA/Sms